MATSMRSQSPAPYLAALSKENSKSLDGLNPSDTLGDIYSVIQHISSTRTLNPEIFGSSRFTEDYAPRSIYAVSEVTEQCWSDIDRDLESLELEESFGSGNDIIPASSLYSSESGDDEYYGIRSQTSQLAAPVGSGSDFDNFSILAQKNPRTLPSREGKSMPWA
ncbi:hypothetical protein ABW19_dt0206698 [Dactylella cylindrospora]|nr:hypothetical protein ABW19_dt0206698 [Dactylella cylindrospora]